MGGLSTAQVVGTGAVAALLASTTAVSAYKDVKQGPFPHERLAWSVPCMAIGGVFLLESTRVSGWLKYPLLGLSAWFGGIGAGNLAGVGAGMLIR